MQVKLSEKNQAINKNQGKPKRQSPEKKKDHRSAAKPHRPITHNNTKKNFKEKDRKGTYLVVVVSEDDMVEAEESKRLRASGESDRL